MSKSRRLARYTAVNIDGALRKAPTKDPTWRTDPRIDKELQTTNDLYKSAPGETVDLQRGHLVRRLDPVWGRTLTERNAAVVDTFLYTNAAPHARIFNDQIWGNLEDYILARAEQKNRKVTVFTGPVFRANDRLFGHSRPGGPYKIPASFWKVVVFLKPGSEPAATGFILDQTVQIAGLFEAFTPMSEAQLRTSQHSLSDIEEIAKIDFGALKNHDRFALIEASNPIGAIRSFSDIVL
jgi:endonuclease G